MAKRIKVDEAEESGGELNLVPYLDIMINLIMFMLFTTSSLTQMGVINVSAPQYGPSSSTSSADDNEEPPVELTLAVNKDGFTVMANGVEIDGHPGKPTIERVAQGRWDFEALTKKMTTVKDTYPNQSTLIMVASNEIEYEIIVKTMDACRELFIKNEKGEVQSNRALFPDVVLGVM